MTKKNIGSDMTNDNIFGINTHFNLILLSRILKNGMTMIAEKTANWSVVSSLIIF